MKTGKQEENQERAYRTEHKKTWLNRKTTEKWIRKG